MKVVLHAGMHKTGTTSFQKWLRSSKPSLEAQGVAVFPTDPRILVNVADCFDPEAIAADLCEAERRGFGLAVFSHETLSECLADDLERLVGFLAPHCLRYVITVRHWDGFLPSRWNSNCRRRDAQSYPAYARGVFENVSARLEARFDLSVRRAIEAGIRDIRVLSYDFEVSRHRLLPSLAEACLLPVDAMRPVDKAVWANASSAPSLPDQLRLFNGIVSQACGRLLNPMAQRSVTGLAPDRFYDLVPARKTILQRRPDIARRLRQLNDAASIPFTLEPGLLREVDEKVTAAMAPWLAPEEHGRLFPETEPRRRTCSVLEVGDVPSDLRQEVLAELRQERPDLFD